MHESPLAAKPPIESHSYVDPDSSLTLLPIQLRFNGFYPKDFYGAPGKYELLLINASGQPDVSFQLNRVNGDGPQTLKQKRGRNLRSVQNLQEGTYVLTVAGRPDLICEIHISGQ